VNSHIGIYAVLTFCFLIPSGLAQNVTATKALRTEVHISVYNDAGVPTELLAAAEVQVQANNEIPSSLVAALPSQPRTDGEPYRPTPTQQFVCNTGYRQKQCDEEMVVLRKALANYPVAQLGNWTWILVRSEDWKAILLPRGLDPDSPAFTFYPKRETFIEEALVTQVPVRGRELVLKWHMGTRDLLDLAIRHELGHALCNDANERNADRVARLLEKGRPVSCEAKAEAKQKSSHHASLN
jgi:hypothetical protein